MELLEKHVAPRFSVQFAGLAVNASTRTWSDVFLTYIVEGDPKGAITPGYDIIKHEGTKRTYPEFTVKQFEYMNTNPIVKSPHLNCALL